MPVDQQRRFAACLQRKPTAVESERPSAAQAPSLKGSPLTPVNTRQQSASFVFGMVFFAD
jgi:hypothetical protein